MTMTTQRHQNIPLVIQAEVAIPQWSKTISEKALFHPYTACMDAIYIKRQLLNHKCEHGSHLWLTTCLSRIMNDILSGFRWTRTSAGPCSIRIHIHLKIMKCMNKIRDGAYGSPTSMILSNDSVTHDFGDLPMQPVIYSSFTDSVTQ